MVQFRNIPLIVTGEEQNPSKGKIRTYKVKACFKGFLRLWKKRKKNDDDYEAAAMKTATMVQGK